MKKIDYSTINKLPEKELVALINEAENEYEDVFKKYRKYSDKKEKLESTLYNLSYHHMMQHVKYFNKYIKVVRPFETIYMYVKYEVFTPYYTKDNKRCYKFVLTGPGCFVSEGNYSISNNLEIDITNDEGKLCPRKPEYVEIITKEEFDKAMKEQLTKSLNEYDSTGSN